MTAAAADQPQPRRPGARIAEKLELVRAVGEGGMGAVWTARNIKTGGTVAIKVLRPDRRTDEHAVARFRYEAKVGATLSHRNITRVFDLLEDSDGSLVLVMELLHGETLREYVKRKGPLSTREAVSIIVPVLSALQHAHDHGIVHRDLKPTNIFLHTDSDGQMTPKLLDFGIAKAEDSSIDTRTGDALGTPRYMSPEQVRAIALDGRSDLFSIGVVLYEIITGANPYPGPTTTAILAQVLELEIDPDPAIDPRVWIELRRALSKTSYQRQASAKELASALCAAIGESEVSLVRTLRSDRPFVAPPTHAVDAHDRDIGEPTPNPQAGPEPEPAAIPMHGLSRRTLHVVVGVGAALLLAGVLALVRASSNENKASTRAETTAASIAPAVSASLPTPSASAAWEPGSTSDEAPAVPKTTTAPTRRIQRPTPAPTPKSTAPSAATSASNALGRNPGF